MIDTWLKTDLENIFGKHRVAVLIDEAGEMGFLHETLRNKYTLHTANSELEELHVKFLIEREASPSGKYLIITHTSMNDLKYLREYCETNGFLEINHLENFIKEKIHQDLKLNINMPKEELITAAKVSLGKDLTYWVDLCHKGATEIFDLEKELLPFLNDPKKYEQEMCDGQLREVFYRKVNELLGQVYMVKPAQTLATEVVNEMLNGLAHGSCIPLLETVYQSWLDSISYKDSFIRYLSKYNLPADIDLWKVSPSHPFRQVDDQWLKVISGDIGNKAVVPNHLARISRRMQNTQALALGITFWGDVKTLLEFNQADISYLSSFKECVDFYTRQFFAMDTAIRNLYTEFLNQRELLEPFQEHYKQLVSIFLDKWFKYFKDYQEAQTGLLKKIIDDNDKKIAVIVGDGISYEIACQVANRINTTYPLTKNVILADLPSETENNMSRIYMDNGVTESVQSNREKYLLEHNKKTTIEFVNLDEISGEASPAQVLICTYKDIDDLGGKLKQKALKYFSESIDTFANKIMLLLKSGFTKVYLISDHGFVLTGLLSEADKISVTTDGDSKKADRYIRTVKPLISGGDQVIEIQRDYDQFNFLYVSRSINPFKTTGVYGYAHGGATPQELITPCFIWEPIKNVTNALSVSIQNKVDLKSVTGEVFPITLQAGQGAGDLFSTERKVVLAFHSGKDQVNKSDIITLQRDQSLTKEFTFDGKNELVVMLLDADTKEQLDRVEIKQNKNRDFGGLF